MNLGFKSKLMRSLFAQIRYAVESYVESCVESYVESSVEPRCRRRFEYVKVVPLSRYSTVLRALFRDDQVVMQPTMIAFPSFPAFPSSSSLFGLKRRHHLCISSHRRQSLHITIVFTGYSQPPRHEYGSVTPPPRLIPLI